MRRGRLDTTPRHVALFGPHTSSGEQRTLRSRGSRARGTQGRSRRRTVCTRQDFVPLVAAGFRVLAIGLRNHGESSWAPPVSFGLYESDDVLAAKAFCGATAVWAESMGASAVLHAVGRVASDADGGVAALGLESGFASLSLGRCRSVARITHAVRQRILCATNSRGPRGRVRRGFAVLPLRRAADRARGCHPSIRGTDTVASCWWRMVNRTHWSPSHMGSL